jgi:hypothetical protein
MNRPRDGSTEKTRTRRALLSGIAGVSVASLAGCLLLQNEIEQSASPAELDQETRDQTGFAHQGTQELTLTQTVEVGGQSRDLSLTNYLATYTRTVPDAEAAVASFQSFSTPSVTVGGSEANPIWGIEPKRVLQRVATGPQMTGFDDVREVGTTELRSLGATRTVTILEGTTERQGQEIVVRLPTATFKHDGDILVVLGGYPRELGGQEQVQTALDGLVHPG